MQVHLKALGCRLNEAELSQWSAQFMARGFDITGNPQEADLTIINTCAVTGEAGRKSRQLIRQLNRENPAAKIVVSGCYATLHPDQISAFLGVDLVVKNSEKDRLVELSGELMALPAAPMAAMTPDTSLFQYSNSLVNRVAARARSRAFVKVQDGCRYRCTFCIVTVARGEERSRVQAEIIDEVNSLYEQGIREVVLTGVHLGGYGSEIDTSLFNLIEAVLKNTDMPRIRMGSLEPWDLPEGFFALFADQRLMPHLHLPLQSGSDKILKRMARRCRTDAFTVLVENARATIADFSLSTDIIVGFPGETEQDWQQTLAYIESVGFAHVHIFPYSPRTGTRAATMPEQVDKKSKKERVRELHQLAKKMKRTALEACVGRRLPVLWESKTGNAESQTDVSVDVSVAASNPLYGGYTPNYLRVQAHATAQQLKPDMISDAVLQKVDESGEFLVAQLVG